MKFYFGLVLATAFLVVAFSQDVCPQGHCVGNKGASGARGKRGSRGEKGSLGRIGLPGRFPPWFHWHNRKGEKGEPGELGAPGAKGRIGLTGAKGVVGDAGDDGNAGAIGARGDRGRDGAAGAKGNQGPQGAKGSTGEGGADGDKGNMGPKGFQGNGGSKGANGDAGAKGEKGENGRPGAAGEQGRLGGDGDPGPKGNRGTGGSSGILGNKGVSGDPGVAGDQGQKGEPGIKGAIGDKGSPGHPIMPIEVPVNPCTAELEGEIRYSANREQLYYCDGDQWMCVKSKPCAGVECVLPDGSTISEHDFFYNASSSESLAKDYACIVTLIDESGTMSGEHSWVPNAIEELEKLLVAEGVGTRRSNVYAIVGFGVPDVSARVVQLNGDTWIPASRYREATGQLKTDGDTEDGYYAIDFAIRNLPFPDSCARNYILVTDERRAESPQGASLTHDRVLTALQDKEIVTNVIINVGLVVVTDDGFDSDAFGVDYLGNAFSVGRGGNFIQSTGDVSVRSDLAFCNSFRDYGDLGLRTNGAVWDLETLRQGAVSTQYSDAFTKAFTEVKSREIIVTSQQCQRCECEDDETGEGKITCMRPPNVAFCMCRFGGKTEQECIDEGLQQDILFDPSTLAPRDCSTLG